MTLRILLPALLLVGALPGAALAQDDGRTIAVQVQLHELPYGFHIAPERINANTGDTLDVEVVNLGKTRHDLVFCAKPGEAPCAELLGKVDSLPANGTGKVQITPTQPGTYVYYCTLPGHLQGNMKGELIVQGEPVGKNGVPGFAPLLALAAVALAALALRRWRA